MRFSLDVALSRRQRALVPVALLIWPLALWLVANGRPPWGDEEHFLATVRLFGNGLSWELLKSYPEMSAPLTYVLYSAWGHVAGFETSSLRILSPFIAWATSVVWYLTLRQRWGASRWTMLGLAAIVLNPYFVGLSVFVFTDMLALLGLAIVTYGVSRDRPACVAGGVAIATLSRQYLAFLVPSVSVAELMTRTTATDRRAGRHAGRHTLATLTGLVPLGLLIISWGWKLAPPSTLRDVYLSEGFRFDPHALSLYLAAPGAYLLPLIVLALPKGGGRQWVTAGALATFVLLFAVQPSIAQTREGAYTVGFVHKAMAGVLPGAVVNIVWWGLATLWLKSLMGAFAVARREWNTGRITFSSAFPWVGCLMFCLVMPFSYMPWEKYALPLFMCGSLVLVEWRSRSVRSPCRTGEGA